MTNTIRPVCILPFFSFAVVSAALLSAAFISDYAAAQTRSVIPSGMDLLYSNRVLFKANGEPLVTIGLMTNQNSVTVSSKNSYLLDYYEEDEFKRVTLAADTEINITIIRSTKIKRDYFLALKTVVHSEQKQLSAALLGWNKRGYKHLKIVEAGSMLGIGGHTLDNRRYRLALPCKNQAAAYKKAQAIYKKYGEQVMVGSKMREHPWGLLQVLINGAPLGTATSFVRFVPITDPHKSLDNLIQPPAPTMMVKSVEHGIGYSSHGREDRRYRGEIYVVVDPTGLLTVVNALGAENIIKGVVPSELFASAHPEALKAQAVAARNHLLAKLGTRHIGDPFHLCSEQHCQVFTGLNREDPRTNAAVDATYGEALFADGKPIHTVYSSTCGGYTENNETVWGGDHDPVLAARPDFDIVKHPELAQFTRGITNENIHQWIQLKPKSFCYTASKSSAKKFRWSKTFTQKELAHLLKSYRKQMGRLQSVTVMDRGTGGKVITLRLQGDRGDVLIGRELTLRRLFKNLNSGAFVLESKTDAKGFVSSLTFKGAGWGHGVGMCQLGAIGRAEAGHTYRQILNHYYNGTSLVELYGKE